MKTLAYECLIEVSIRHLKNNIELILNKLERF